MKYFADFLKSPIITLLMTGFYVKDFFDGIGLSALGWVFGIAVTIFMYLKILLFISFVYRTAKKIIKSFKN